jgi:hypothetical protein
MAIPHAVTAHGLQSLTADSETVLLCTGPLGCRLTVNLRLCLAEYRAIMMEAQLLIILATALVSRSDRFTLGESAASTHWVGG